MTGILHGRERVNELRRQRREAGECILGDGRKVFRGGRCRRCYGKDRSTKSHRGPVPNQTTRTPGYTFCSDIVRRAVNVGLSLHRECDCGTPLTIDSRCCGRCRFLDGETEATARVIGELRQVRPATVYEIAENLNTTVRTVWRALAELRARGRVVSQIDDFMRDYWGDTSQHRLVERRAA